MSEMLVRVADAIYSCQFGTRMAGDFSEADAKVCARAAIEAMREPTTDMLDATYDVGPESSRIAWQAMIDAALLGSKPQSDIS